MYSFNISNGQKKDYTPWIGQMQFSKFVNTTSVWSICLSSVFLMQGYYCYLWASNGAPHIQRTNQQHVNIWQCLVELLLIPQVLDDGSSTFKIFFIFKKYCSIQNVATRIISLNPACWLPYQMTRRGRLHSWTPPLEHIDIGVVHSEWWPLGTVTPDSFFVRCTEDTFFWLNKDVHFESSWLVL